MHAVYFSVEHMVFVPSVDD